MRRALALLGLISLEVAARADIVVDRPTFELGIYSNEEQVYFEKEAGRTPPLALTVILAESQPVRAIDSFGKPATLPAGFNFIRTTIGIAGVYPGGQVLELRKARPVTCWASLKRDKSKPDGKEDWTFAKDIKLHDQGGRALVGKGEAGIKPVVLRMRNVTWGGSGRSTNRPSLVLYVHTQEDQERAVSYVWSDPGAARLGVNLRWMQASCTVDGMEKQVTN